MGWGRGYYAVQAAAGAAWWVAVFTSGLVRDLTLGGLDPVLVAAWDIPLFVVASALAAAGVRGAAVVSTGWTALIALSLAGYATATTQAGWGVVAMIAAATGSVLALCLVRLGRIPTEWLMRGPFAFRPAARRSSTAPNLLATFGQIAAFWALFLIVIPLSATLLEQRWLIAVPFPVGTDVIGAVLLVVASAAGIWSAVVMATLGNGTPLPAAMPNTLVIAGPYRWVRNPMAVASISQGVAVGLILSSWVVIVYAVAGALLWNYAVRPHEEADLERRFGAAFRRYREAVRCWIPRRPIAARRAQPRT